MVTLGNLLRKRSDTQDGYRVVGCAEVRQHYQRGHAELGFPSCSATAVEELHQPVYTASLTDDLHQSCSQQSHDDEFAHPHDAVVHGSEPSERRQGSGCDSHHASQNSCRSEDEHHIHAGKCRHYYIYVRYDGGVEDFAKRVGANTYGGHACIKYEADEGCGQGNPNVGAELVLHLAALCLSRHNRCVGDEAEVVAEISSANHYRHHHGNTASRLFRHSACNGDEGCDSADAGSRSKRDEARSEEQTAQDEVGRHSRQGQPNRRIDGAHLLCCRRKSSCQDEYPQHLHHSRRCRSFCKIAETLTHALTPDEHQTVERRSQECNCQWDGIEIICCKTQKQVKQQKYYQRTQSEQALFCRNTFFHAAKLHIFPQIILFLA